jgi:site-specific recombinase XerD
MPTLSACYFSTLPSLAKTPSQLHLEQIDAKMVLSFLHHIETERKNGPVTRNGRLAAVKSFMRYIEHQVPSALDQVRQILAMPFKRVFVESCG